MVRSAPVLGFALGDKESEASWKDFFQSLKARGLSGVDLVVSDDHAGLVKAIEGSFIGASWQRCLTLAMPLAKYVRLFIGVHQIFHHGLFLMLVE